MSSTVNKQIPQLHASEKTHSLLTLLSGEVSLSFKMNEVRRSFCTRGTSIAANSARIENQYFLEARGDGRTGNMWNRAKWRIVTYMRTWLRFLCNKIRKWLTVIRRVTLCRPDWPLIIIGVMRPGTPCMSLMSAWWWMELPQHICPSVWSLIFLPALEKFWLLLYVFKVNISVFVVLERLSLSGHGQRFSSYNCVHWVTRPGLLRVLAPYLEPNLSVVRSFLVIHDPSLPLCSFFHS